MDITHEELADAYGTPLYVYDLQQVRAAYESLKAVLPTGSRLYYSLKANPHPDVIASLLALGCHAEASSEGEIDAAVHAGASPERILFTGPGKSPRAIAHALKAGVRRFSVESAADLTRVARGNLDAGTHSECLLRVNRDTPLVGSSLTMTGVSSQFGIDASELLNKPEYYRSLKGAEVVGFHLYSGSNIGPENVLVDHFHDNAVLAAQISAATGLPLQEVDLGGGFPARYAGNGTAANLLEMTDLAPRINDVWSRHHVNPLTSFESGRFLVAASGSLLCRVVDSKVSKGKSYLVLESGINHLGGMSGLRRLPRPQPVLQVLGQKYGQVHGSVVGPLCTPVDSLASGVEVPITPAGELIRIQDVGAYGLTASLIAFLGHPAPAEVVVDGEHVISVSRLEMNRLPVTAQS